MSNLINNLRVLRFLGPPSLFLLIVFTIHFVSITSRTYSTYEDAQAACGDTFHAIFQDGWFEDIYRIDVNETPSFNADDAPYHSEREISFACSRGDAEDIIRFMDLVTIGVFALFAIVWLPPLMIFIVFNWLWLEWVSYKKRHSSKQSNDS